MIGNKRKLVSPRGVRAARPELAHVGENYEAIAAKNRIRAHEGRSEAILIGLIGSVLPIDGIGSIVREFASGPRVLFNSDLPHRDGFSVTLVLHHQSPFPLSETSAVRGITLSMPVFETDGWGFGGLSETGKMMEETTTRFCLLAYRCEDYLRLLVMTF